MTQAMGVNSLAQSITGWQQVYDQLTPGPFHGALNELLMGPVQLFMESSSRALVQTCQTWPQAVWFGVPVRPEQISHIEGTPIEADMVAVRSGQTEFQLTTPNDFGFFGVVVQTDTLQRYTAQEGSAELLSQALSRPVLKVADAAINTFRWWLTHTLQTMAVMPDTLTPQMLEHLLDDTLSRLVFLLTQQEQQPRETVATLHARRVMQRVRDYVVAHNDQCVKVHDLCAQLGISRRALQDCFHKTMGCTPKAYLSAFGLNAARRALEQATPEQTTVSDIATRYGFWHLSQFAADYRKFFGELPSQTLRERQPMSAR